MFGQGFGEWAQRLISGQVVHRGLFLGLLRLPSRADGSIRWVQDKVQCSEAEANRQGWQRRRSVRGCIPGCSTVRVTLSAPSWFSR